MTEPTWRLLAIVTVLVWLPETAVAQTPALTTAQIADFLRTAEVIDSEHTSKGLTNPWKLRLSDGEVTHDASFQSVDKRRNNVSFRGGGAELNFVDSFAYNIGIS